MEEKKFNNFHYYKPFVITLSICGYVFSAVYLIKYKALIASMFMFTGPTTALFYMHLRKNVFFSRKTAYILLGVIFYTLTGSSLFTGGHNSTAIWWFSVIPLTSGIFLGIKKSFYSMSLCLVIIIIEYILGTQTDLLINEFANQDQEVSKLLSLLALNIAISTLTYIYLSITYRINSENEKLNKKINKEKVSRAFNQGLFETAQNTLHILGNSLTLVKTNIDLLQKEDAIKSLIDVSKAYYAGISKNENNQKQIAYTKYIIETLESIKTNKQEQLLTTNEKLDYVINTIDQMSKTKIEISKEKMDLTKVINEILTDMKNTFTHENIRIKSELNDKIELLTEPTRFENALRTSLKNSVDSIIEKKKIDKTFVKPEIVIRTEEDEKHYHLSLKDNGIGLEEENAKQVFKLGFSTKRDGGGYNLHNTANYVRSLGGNINFKTSHSDGACLVMKFPKQKKALLKTGP